MKLEYRDSWILHFIGLNWNFVLGQFWRKGQAGLRMDIFIVFLGNLFSRFFLFLTFDLGTSHLIFLANQITGFYVKMQNWTEMG